MCLDPILDEPGRLFIFEGLEWLIPVYASGLGKVTAVTVYICTGLGPAPGG